MSLWTISVYDCESINQTVVIHKNVMQQEQEQPLRLTLVTSSKQQESSDIEQEMHSKYGEEETIMQIKLLWVYDARP